MLKRSTRLGGAAAGLALLTACSPGGPSPVASTAASTSRYLGIELPIHPALPHVALRDTRGQRVDPGADAGPAVTVLFTGYTHCADVCPTTMADVAAALRQDPSLQRAVRVLFVSTDPRRDTGPRIRAWLDGFDRSFVGLRGTLAQVRTLSVALGLPAPEDDGTTHSSELLAFTRGHGAHLAWIGEPDPKTLVHDLRLLVHSAT